MNKEANPAALLGQRIKDARERLKWTQGMLAEKVNLGSAQIISSIESGSREVKASELTRIASALRTTVDNILNPDLRPEPQFSWREQPKEGFEEHEARFLLRCERYGLLEKWCGFNNSQALPTIKFTSQSPSYSQVQTQADNVRNSLQLGGRPACSLEKTLEEDYAVKIFYEELGSNGGAGSSVTSWFGNAVLLNASQVRWRRNYSLAHELFHLLTKGELLGCTKERIEQLADVFASSLLLPSEHLYSALSTRLTQGGTISFDSIVEIAREFDVSIEALLWRLVNIGRLDAKTVKAALESSTLRAIDKASFPVWKPAPELPERYVRLSLLAYRQGKIGLMKLAEFLEKSVIDLATEVAEAGEIVPSGEQTEIAVAGC